MAKNAKRVKKAKITPQLQKVRLNFFSRITEVLGNTENYFAAVKNESYSEPLLYYLPFMIINSLLGAFTLSEALFLPASTAILITFFIGEIVFQLAGIFLIAGINQVCLRMCKGQGKYLDTFKAEVYGYTPGLLWAIPNGLLMLVLYPLQEFWLFLPILAFRVWSIVLEVRGLSLYHKISRTRAFWAGIMLPMAALSVAIFVIFFVLALIVGFIFLGAMGSGI